MFTPRRRIDNHLKGLVAGFLVWISPMLAVGLTPGVGAAAVPSQEVLTKEPDRYAFISGIGYYNEHGSSMGDLLTACDEAVAFRKQLLAMGWRADHIYPIVPASASGASAEQSVRDSICDLKTIDLRTGLVNFSNMMLDNEGNPYGVVYIASHGAQSDGNQYVFGVDSDLSFTTELRRAQQAPNYKVFADSGVDVLDIVSRVSRVNGHAMLLILDACRSNPALEKYRSAVTEARDRDPNLVARLSAGYLSTDDKADSPAADFDNIIVLFSTRPLKEASGAAPGKTTEFSQAVLEMLRNGAAAQASGPSFVDAIVSAEHGKQANLARYDRQIPDRLGSMAISPVFCFKGCAQPLTAWSHQSVKLITAATPPAAPIARGRLMPKRLESGAAQLALRPVRASYEVAPEPEAGPLAALAPPPKSLNVDVFYCLGDSGVAARKSAAERYAQLLRMTFPADRLIDRYAVNRIRLVSFDPVANPSMARGKTGTSIWIDRGSDFERGWASRFAELGDGAVIKENLVTKTKDYISVFFCGDLQADARPVSSVYLQVPTHADLDRGRLLLASIRSEVTGVTVIPTPDPVDDRVPQKVRSPNNSEVRYYTDDQAVSANQIAAALNNHLSATVHVRKVPVRQRPKNPVIEIWIGLNEAAAWRLSARPQGGG